MKNEELVYDIISEIISKTIKDEEAMGSENDKPSLLLTILKTERLDMREKISGTIGEFNVNCQSSGLVGVRLKVGLD